MQYRRPLQRLIDLLRRTFKRQARTQPPFENRLGSAPSQAAQRRGAATETERPTPGDRIGADLHGVDHPGFHIPYPSAAEHERITGTPVPQLRSIGIRKSGDYTPYLPGQVVATSDLYGRPGGLTSKEKALDLAALRVMQAVYTARPELVEDLGFTGERPAEQLARVLGNPERAALIRDGVTSRLGQLEHEQAGPDNQFRRSRESELRWFKDDLATLYQSGKEFAPLSSSGYAPMGKDGAELPAASEVLNTAELPDVFPRLQPPDTLGLS